MNESNEIRRRGSGYSINLSRGPCPPYGPYMIPHPVLPPTSYPMLMSPQPSYYYGMQPPYPIANQGHPMMMEQPTTPLRRAGSINAKIMSQDARRPFGNASQHHWPEIQMPASELEYGSREMTKGSEGLAKDDETSTVIDQLKTVHQKREESFLEKLKFWSSANKSKEEMANETLSRSYSIRKINGEYNPQNRSDVIIEEIMDSASVVNEDNIRYNKGLPEKNDESLSVLGADHFSAGIRPSHSIRWKHSTPINTVVMFVPQQEAWVVERMGKFHRILEPGLNVLIPILDRVKYVQSLKEITIDIPQQTAISMDNVTINIDGVLYLRILDPYRASYGVEEPEFAITQLAQTTMRSEIGKITLDTLFKERESLNHNIVTAINQAADAWGISCMRYEIRDIRMPTRVQEAMQMQVEAERKKRASILESEGIKAAEINIAEGKKQARILSSEAEKRELINSAEGSAQAVIVAGEARAQSIELISSALTKSKGPDAASLAVAEKYVTAFGELAKKNNTLILPANTGDVSSMVAQAMTIFKKLENPLPPVEEEEKIPTKNDTFKIESSTVAPSIEDRVE